MSSLLSDGERYVVIETENLSPMATEADAVLPKVCGEENIDTCSFVVLLTATGGQLGVGRTNIKE